MQRKQPGGEREGHFTLYSSDAFSKKGLAASQSGFNRISRMEGPSSFFAFFISLSPSVSCSSALLREANVAMAAAARCPKKALNYEPDIVAKSEVVTS